MLEFIQQSVNDFGALVVGLLVALILGATGASIRILLSYYRYSRKTNEPDEDYASKIGRLTNHLNKASREIDHLLAELTAVAKSRATAVVELEHQVQLLNRHEQEAKRRVEELNAIPIPIAEYFSAVVRRGERSSALRDYVLFVTGVVASTIIAIVLKTLGP